QGMVARAGGRCPLRGTGARRTSEPPGRRPEVAVRGPMARSGAGPRQPVPRAGRTVPGSRQGPSSKGGGVAAGGGRCARWGRLPAVGRLLAVGWLPAARSGRRGGIAVDALRLTQLTGKGG